MWAISPGRVDDAAIWLGTRTHSPHHSPTGSDRPAQPDSGVRPTDWASVLESAGVAPAHTGWPCSLNTTN